jgi:hypothetical protein
MHALIKRRHMKPLCAPREFHMNPHARPAAGRTTASDRRSSAAALADDDQLADVAGSQGLAVITGSGNFGKHVEDPLNHLVLMPTDAWTRHVSEFAQGLKSPIHLKIALAE